MEIQENPFWYWGNECFGELDFWCHLEETAAVQDSEVAKWSYTQSCPHSVTVPEN